MTAGGTLDVIREQDMATHRMGFVVLAIGLLCVVVAIRLWQTGRRKSATAVGVVGFLVSMTGCAYTQLNIMV